MAENDQAKIVKTLFNQSISALRAKQYDIAKDGFQQVLNINPKSAEAYLNLGNVYFFQNDIPNAISNLKKAQEIDPALAKTYINLGNCYYKEGNYKDAIGYWSIAVNLASNNEKLLRNIAVAYEKTGNNSKAFYFYEEFLKHCKGSDAVTKSIRFKVSESKRVAYHNLNAGVQYQKRKNFAGAASAYSKSIELYPNFSKAHLNLGSIYFMGNNYDLAIESWEEALKLDSEHPNTHCNLAICYDKKKKIDEAFYHYKMYLDLTHGRSKDAPQIKKRMDEIEKLLEGKKELVRQHLNKANELYSTNQLEEAIYEYKKYAVLNARGGDIPQINQRIQETEDRLNPAKKAMETAKKMGDEYFQANLFDKAIAAYNRYLTFNKKGPEASEVSKKLDICHKHIGNVVAALLKSD